MANKEELIDILGGYMGPSSGPIASYPASVQNNIERARTLLQKDGQEGLGSEYKEALSQLARTNPELFAATLMIMAGVDSITSTETVTDKTTVPKNTKILGITVKRDTETTVNTKTTSRTISLNGGAGGPMRASGSQAPAAKTGQTRILPGKSPYGSGGQGARRW